MLYVQVKDYPCMEGKLEERTKSEYWMRETNLKSLFSFYFQINRNVLGS